MEPEVLNRIGIILNFLAGFLLAPELLGTERLDRMEGFLERTADRLAERASLAKSKVGLFFVDFIYNSRNLSFRPPPPSTPLSKRIIFWVQLILFFCFVVFSLSWIFYERVQKSSFLLSTLGLLSIAALSIIFLMDIAIPVLIIAKWAIVGVLVLFARFVIKALVGESKLRSVLVVLGVICFIVGNILQFIATF